MAMPYDKRHDQVPIRADMATIINGPMGITESSAMSKSAPPMSSAVHSKRVELKEMLIGRLCKMHGADPVRRAVIEREVANSSVLQSGKLSAQALASLERAVADAVRATQPGPMVSHQKPAQDCTKVWKAGEMAAAVKKASNWTEVARHRASFHAIEQTAKTDAAERRKVELQLVLNHQAAQESHKAAAERALVAEEAAEVKAELKEYHAEMRATAAKARAKSEAQKRDREVQLREQAARSAAAARLEKYENDELKAHMARELEAEAKRKEAKARANADYHRTTAIANAAAREKREADKQAEWAEEQRLNAQWKAMLDKQEADREGQYRRLREKIHAMQRVYEDNAGAEEERRLAEEEAVREKYVREEAARAEAEYMRKRETKQAAIQSTTKYLFEQMSEQEAEREREKAAEARYAQHCREDAKLGEEKQAKQKALTKARALSQQHYLNEQITAQREQAGRDPGASEMTALEATINRPLLVSIVQHKHLNPNPLT